MGAILPRDFPYADHWGDISPKISGNILIGRGIVARNGMTGTLDV